MKRLLLVFLLLTTTVHALTWSEILFDPVGADDGQEFIELVGDTPLHGCTIADARSSDVLELLQKGSDVILIIETDSPLNSTPEATIYGAGKAIGNGLGNTYEELTLTCAEEELLHTNYNTSIFDGFVPGQSIHYHDNTWVTGNASPGEIEVETPDAEPFIQRELPCNTTLVVTLGTTTAHVNDTVQFTLVSDGYASYEAYADGQVFTYGDTLTQRAHSFTVPDAKELRIVAQARQCQGRQRAIRIITVQPPANRTIENRTNVELATPPLQNSSVHVQVPRNTTPPEETIYDENKSVVPWVSSFGVVTLLVSAWTYHHTYKNEKSI